METENSNLTTYSPAAVLNLFNNSISVNQTKRIVQLKGIYVQGKGGQYSGYYYDTFRDEASDAAITILVPPLIRNELQPNKTVTVNGFVTRRVINYRNYIHFIRSKSSKALIGMVDILSPSLVKDHYALSQYPYFIEFYLRSESQGNSLMSEILPPLLNVIKQHDIDQVAAVADKKNLAARRLLEKTGFVYKAAFDLTKDLFLI